MRAIVTGATGYIGGRLLARLMADGAEVCIVVRPKTVLAPTLSAAEAEERLAVHRHDPQAVGSTETLVERVCTFAPDTVFHLAALCLGTHDSARLRALLEANVIFGAEMLEATSKAGDATFIATGTFWEYGLGDETYRPTSLYAASKRAFRDLMLYFQQAEGLRAVELKLFDVYGPDDPRGRLLDLLLDAQATGKPLPLSPGEQRVDLVHVEDVVDAYLHAAKALRTSNVFLERTDYMVSSGYRLTVREVVARLEAISRRHVPVTFGARDYRPREVMEPWRGKALPGWRPNRTLGDGLTEMIAAHRQEPFQDDGKPQNQGQRCA